MKKSNYRSYCVRDLASHCGALLEGDGAVVVTGIASIESAVEGELVFASDEVKLQQALGSCASAIVAGDFGRQTTSLKPILVADNPKLTFAQIAALFAAGVTREGRDESAQVHLSAKIGERTWIGPGVVIEAGVTIGDGTSIGANSLVSEAVSIGEESQIGPNVAIYSRTSLGKRCVVQAGSVLGSTGFGYVRDEQGRYRLFPQIGSLVIEDNVEIGANCTIDRGALDATIIRRGTKIDNMVHIGHNVDIGEDVVIAAQTGISGSCRIGSRVVVGGQVGIGDHAIIEDGVIVGSGSGILPNKVVRGNGIVFWGTPARPLKQYLRELATLSRLAGKKQK